MANLITNVNQACADLANIKRAITDKGVEVASGTPSSEYADKVNEVYEAGKQAEQDAFWSAYQDDGNRTNYSWAFSNTGWKDANFAPKYDMNVSNATAMFSGCRIADLEACFAKNGAKLNTSNSTNFNQAFFSALFTVIPELVISAKATNTTQMFNNNGSLHTIRKLTFEEGFSGDLTNAFASCSSLANVEFAGVLSVSITIHHCPLTKASITSLINTLSGTVSGKTLTLKQTAKEAAFTDAEWDALISTKSNWTISLV